MSFYVKSTTELTKSRKKMIDAKHLKDISEKNDKREMALGQEKLQGKKSYYCANSLLIPRWNDYFLGKYDLSN